MRVFRVYIVVDLEVDCIQKRPPWEQNYDSLNHALEKITHKEVHDNFEST